MQGKLKVLKVLKENGKNEHWNNQRSQEDLRFFFSSFKGQGWGIESNRNKHVNMCEGTFCELGH